MSSLLLLGEAETLDLSSFITALTGSITVSQVLTILASIIGIGMTFVLMWFGVRKSISIFMKAFKNGTVRG